MRDRLCCQAVVQVRVYVSFRCFLTTKEDTKLQGVKFEGTLKTMMSRCMMCSAIYSCRKTFEVPFEYPKIQNLKTSSRLNREFVTLALAKVLKSYQKSLYKSNIRWHFYSLPLASNSIAKVLKTIKWTRK